MCLSLGTCCTSRAQRAAVVARWWRDILKLSLVCTLSTIVLDSSLSHLRKQLLVVARKTTTFVSICMEPCLQHTHCGCVTGQLAYSLAAAPCRAAVPDALARALLY